MQNPQTDPYPTTYDGVLRELMYWSSQVGNGHPGSTMETQVRARLDVLIALADKFYIEKLASMNHHLVRQNAA